MTVNIDTERKSLVLVDAVGVSKGAEVSLSRYQRAVLEALAQPLFLKVGARSTQLADLLPEMNRRNLYRVLNALLDRKLIDQEQRGEPFRITVDGLEALGIKGEIQEVFPF